MCYSICKELFLHNDYKSIYKYTESMVIVIYFVQQVIITILYFTLKIIFNQS